MAPIFSCPKIKFCGLTRPEDVETAIECGADALGFNFVESSSRFLVTPLARQLVSIAKGRVACVGVFVNQAPSMIAEIVAACDLDCVQLHGDETISWAREASTHRVLARLPFIKAVSWRGNESDARLVSSWLDTPLQLIAFLVDAYDPVQKGGTGKTVRWDLLNPRPSEFGHIPILLAGGLTPLNVQTAMTTAMPDGIDLASGIESSPGIKDPEKMRSLVRLVRAISVHE